MSGFVSSASVADPHELLAAIRDVHALIRDAVVAACEEQSLEDASRAVADEGGDTIFAIDRVSEAVLVEHFARLAQRWPMVLVAEGLGSSGTVVLPAGATPDIRVLVDPIDGTRGLMYQKRPAWILTAVAPEAPGVSLTDVELAVMTEIPVVKQHLCDQLWARRGHGVEARRVDRLDGTSTPFVPRPSSATSIAGGFGAVSRFFPGGREVLAAIDDELVEMLVGSQLVFEDQYLATGGQLAELMLGHDRWVADLRPLVRPSALACHPYDVCVELIAREAGAFVTDPWGQALDVPLDVHTPVAWVGAANETIHRDVIGNLRRVLAARGLSGPDHSGPTLTGESRRP